MICFSSARSRSAPVEEMPSLYMMSNSASVNGGATLFLTILTRVRLPVTTPSVFFYSPHRRHQTNRRRGNGQSHARQNRQKQGGPAVHGGGIRHHVQRGHLFDWRTSRSRAGKANHREARVMVELQGHPTGARPRCRQRSFEKRPGALPGNRDCPQSEARRGQTVKSHDVSHALAVEAHFFLRCVFVASRAITARAANH